jgi:hypothetical protein
MMETRKEEKAVKAAWQKRRKADPHLFSLVLQWMEKGGRPLKVTCVISSMAWVAGHTSPYT